MIVFEQFAVAAPPCVYAHWFLYCCTAVGLKTNGQLPGLIHRPATLHSRPVFLLSMVRHPLSWLHNYHEKFKAHETRVPEVDIFRDDYRGTENDFGLFVQTYLKRHAGSISKMFEAYNPSTVIRVEDLPWAAAEFFQSIGIIDQAPIAQYVFEDMAGGWMADKELRRDVVKAEQEFCLQMDYY